MAWGQVELEPEVEQWLVTLSLRGAGQAAFAIDLLEQRGAGLGFPHTSQLAGSLRELRFFVEGQPTRISYYIATGRRIILLTVFPKTARTERREIERAVAAMRKCQDEAHTAEEEE